MKKMILSSMVLMFALAGAVHAAGDAEAGKTKAAACGRREKASLAAPRPATKDGVKEQAPQSPRQVWRGPCWS